LCNEEEKEDIKDLLTKCAYNQFLMRGFFIDVQTSAVTTGHASYRVEINHLL